MPDRNMTQADVLEFLDLCENLQVEVILDGGWGVDENTFGIEYQPAHLTGQGEVGGRKVRTIDAHWMVTFHTWYEPDENDYHDVKLLCDEFKISLPEVYRRFEK